MSKNSCCHILYHINNIVGCFLAVLVCKVTMNLYSAFFLLQKNALYKFTVTFLKPNAPQKLNSTILLSIHETYCVIIAGASPGEDI